MSGGGFGSFRPLGMPGGGRRNQQIVAVEAKKSWTRQAVTAANNRRKARTDADRDRSRARRAWAGDWAAELGVVAAGVVLLVVGPVWLAVVVVVVGVAVTTAVPVVSEWLKLRRASRRDRRRWFGDSRGSGMVHGLGLVAAGRPADLIDWSRKADGTTTIRLALPPGVTVAKVSAKRDELAAAFGAGFVEVVADGPAVAVVTLRPNDPLDGVVEAGWATPEAVEMPEQVLIDGQRHMTGGKKEPWWMAVDSRQPEEGSSDE